MAKNVMKRKKKSTVKIAKQSKQDKPLKRRKKKPPKKKKKQIPIVGTSGNKNTITWILGGAVLLGILFLLFGLNSNKKRRIRKLPVKIEKNNSLSLSEKKEIWTAMWADETKAIQSSEKKYPEVSNNDMQEFRERGKKRHLYKKQMEKRYNKKTTRRFNITKSQLKSITKEGLTKKWKIPN
ncbi:MAG: hypothetical protein U9O87_09195 [Verrucomicrobiota bacterium]|nr:hypothetical protein [Verrucomicrobiota bacterium]